MKLKQLLAILCLFISSSLYAQPRCGFDEIHKKRIQTDSAYKANVEKESERIRQVVKQIKTAKIKPLSATATYIIPVVVHIVHTGEAVGTIYNPSDAQIEGAIDYLNSVYAGTFPGAEGVGDMQIQFALARRDPNCNITTGITRTNGTVIDGYEQEGVFAQTSGTHELNIKNLIRWDPTQYYNIWVVNRIDGADGTSGSFIAGFAYFPEDPSYYDGTVMLATQMKTGAKTLPHEIGHALSLYHPFQGSNATTCAPADNCATTGDEVCDTEPILQPTNLAACRVGATNTCTNLPYTINSEKNFMNYASCYTLFTQDQKTRALAVMANSPSRISLANSYGDLDPSEGPVTCAPKIDFELTSDSKSELTTIDGICRDYTDYTYKLQINRAPSATAVATLTVGGTATEKVDYDITTNNNFTTTSKNLTFTAGSVTEQIFTIRIYNDAIVDGIENLVLGFILNNGGGDAEIGYRRPNLTLRIIDNDNVPTSGTTLGNGNIGSSIGLLAQGPFDARQAKKRTQFLYRASELTAAGIPAGNISGLALHLSKNSTRPYLNFTVKVGTTLLNNLIDGSTVYIVNGTTVKMLSSYSTTMGWNNFVFDAPFNWDGTSNVVVEVCYDNGVTDGANAIDNVSTYSDGGSSTQGNLFWQAGINCAESFSSVGFYTNGYKPIIRFNYGIPGTIVQTALNTSKQEYLGPNADIYFYDQTDNKLFARIKNLSNHDYGCTTVEIDRAGTSTSAFTSSSTSQHLLDKTFKVIPTNNSPSGNYEITLYYTNEEKAGWENTTGQSWNNIFLIKTPQQISSYTPEGNNPGGVATKAIATPSMLGTQHGLTASFTNGFSGFGAGIPVVVLPLALLHFDGQLVDRQVKLNWSTSFEQQTKEFEIEKSTDGVIYTKIGTIKAAGNGFSVQNYFFTDVKLSPTNYYRLKMNDQDGTHTLSKILSFKFDDANRNVWLDKIIIKDQITVHSSKELKRLHLQLIDNNGIIIDTYQVRNGVTSFKWMMLNKLSSGIYFVRAFADDQVYTFKIIKE
jgi:hypothetical protein